MSQDLKPHEKHDFNWARARRDCDLEREFGLLMDALEQAVEVVKLDPPPSAREIQPIVFNFSRDPYAAVRKKPGSTTVFHFELYKDMIVMSDCRIPKKSLETPS